MSRETEIHAEDEQVFLNRQDEILHISGATTQINPRMAESMRASALGKASPRSPATPGMQGSPKKVLIISSVFNHLTNNSFTVGWF